MTVIKTITGRYFDFLHPEEFDYRIEEIAWALSKLNRFTGHTTIDYSVARHSVLVSNLCTPPFRMEGLLHDGTEAFCGDVASPLKALLPGYKRIERRVGYALRAAFGLPKEESPQVKRLDRFALGWENRRIMVRQVEQHPAGFVESTGITLWPLQETTAVEDCDAFLLRYFELLTAAPVHSPPGPPHQVVTDDAEEVL